MRIAIVVMFRDEERHLPTMLESLASQSRPPDRVVLVDDGSVDGSAQVAAEWVGRFPSAEVLHRPRQPATRDRLAAGTVWASFQWAVERLDSSYDVVAKVDADLRLGPHILEEIEARFVDDAQLGLTGPYLSEFDAIGRLTRLAGRPEHVAGAVKFYRWGCYEDVYPLPPLLNTDMVDEAKARSKGWRTASFESADGDPLHLRLQGSRDGSLRAYRRWGEGDYASGSHPLLVAFVGLQRMGQRPVVLGGLNYFAGWLAAAVRRAPRFDDDVLAFRRKEQLARVRERVGAPFRRARRTET